MDVKIFWSYRNTKGTAPSATLINTYKDKGIIFDEANKVIYANGLPYYCESHDNLPYLKEHQGIKTLDGVSLVGTGNIPVAKINGKSLIDSNEDITIDLSLYEVVTSLPTTGLANKIYLVSAGNAGGDGNVYIEYAYIKGAWEELGRYQAKIDLGGYATEDYVDKKVREHENQVADTYVSKTEDAPYHEKVDSLPNIEILTYDEYIEMLDKDPDTLYFIKGDIDVAEMELGWEHLTRENN